jgi:hypothetical protein
MRAFLPAIAMSLLALRQDQDYDKLLKEAKFTLAEAVDLAVKASKAERTPLQAWIEERNGKRKFVVNGSQGDRIFSVSMDLAEGKVLLTALGKTDRSAIANAFKIKLADAIQTALQREKGQVVKVVFDLNAERKPEGTVTVFNNGKIRVVTIDGETGKITAVKDN